MSDRLAGRKVRELVQGRVSFEVGSAAATLGDRVAVVAHWSARLAVTRSVRTLVGEFHAAGYHVVVASSCEAAGELDWGDGADRDRLIVLRKPNLGYDFGSWSIALDRLPGIARARQVILVNDSMVGPFVTLGPLLSSFEQTSADVWGLTDTQQFSHHLQSYFLGFRGGILEDRPLRDFWSGIRHEIDKDRIIFRNEIGLSRLLREEGYISSPAFPHELVVEPGLNPVIKGWKPLLERGFPFLKREILHDPTVAPEGGTAGQVVRDLFDVEIEEWVEPAA